MLSSFLLFFQFGFRRSGSSFVCWPASWLSNKGAAVIPMADRSPAHESAMTRCLCICTAFFE